MESMAGFIHEVVPQVCSYIIGNCILKITGEFLYLLQAYGGCQTGEAVDPILWAKMEQIEGIDCLSQSSSCHKTNLPLLIVLGYASGIQVHICRSQVDSTLVLVTSQ